MRAAGARDGQQTGDARGRSRGHDRDDIPAAHPGRAQRVTDGVGGAVEVGVAPVAVGVDDRHGVRLHEDVAGECPHARWAGVDGVGGFVAPRVHARQTIQWPKWGVKARVPIAHCVDS